MGLESESESELDDKATAIPIPDPILTKEYQLPRLQPPSSFDECRRRNEAFAPKLQAAVDTWSSPSCKDYKMTNEATSTWLMQRSLSKMEVMQARAAALKVQKKRLVACQSLSKGGSLLASDAL
jgi:hypothetical protein